MKIRHLTNRALDRPAYDACVSAAPNGIIYGLSWWLDVVSPGWEVLVWEGEAGNYRAVLPIPVRRQFGVRFVQQPLFCQFLAIFSVETLGPIEHGAFLDALQKQVRFVARFCLTELSTEEVEAVKIRQTHLLGLTRPYETIRAGYNADRKLNLKRAEQAGWEIIQSHEIGTLIQFFRENHEHQIAGGTAQWAYPMLERLFAGAERRGYSTLWYASKNGQVEAGAWIVTWKNRAIYLFNAATPLGRQGNGRTFLLDQFFRENAGKELTFDFESPEIRPITEFYQSFGAKSTPFFELSYNHLPGWVNALWRVKQFLTR
ncbi:MAG: GNAT family N-acetyltransferase [Cytophagaceae bacterium]|nr:GNAT family N-acetyltransferase [Cytophagaceae bacterium]